MDNAVNERFQNESKAIYDYVSYIENNFYQRSCSVVRTQGYEDLSILNDYVFYTDDAKEKDENRKIIERLKNIVDSKISQLKTKRNQMEPKDLPTINEILIENDLVDGLVGYIESTVYDCMDNPNNKEYYELIDGIVPTDLKKEIDLQDEDSEDKYYDKLTVDDYLNVLCHVRCKLYNDLIDNIDRDLEEYRELKTLYNIFDEKAAISIYRQAFILLMTAFDAAIFDAFTQLATQDFFNISKVVNYEKKFSLSDITKFHDYNEFTESTIEAMISGKYVSDILEMLHKYNENFYYIDENDSYDVIMEMIQRRNLHVHKNGLVDEKYFTKGNGSLSGLHVGDYASVDSLYFNAAYDTLKAFVSKITT